MRRIFRTKFYDFSFLKTKGEKLPLDFSSFTRIKNKRKTVERIKEEGGGMSDM